VKDSEFLILGNDQRGERVTVYDVSRIPENGFLEHGEIASFPSDQAAGVKYRENTVFGNVLLIGGTFGYILSYPSGKILWSTHQSGRNTHSVEILPGGNIVFANSSGNDIRLFYTSSLLSDNGDLSETYVSYPFESAHGLLYDPVYECLWVIGRGTLAAYRILGCGSSQTLEPRDGWRWSLAEFGNGGHDLSPDLLDSRYLYCTPAKGVLRFDKETGTFDRSFADGTPLQSYSYKSFTQMPDGSFVYTTPYAEGRRNKFEGWWKASWCTDFIGVLRPLPDGGREEARYFAEEAAFYKARAFCGRYL